MGRKENRAKTTSHREVRHRKARDKGAVRKRIRELGNEIHRHNDLYYNRGQPEITDSQYDELIRELRELEREHPELVPDDSPVRQVGALPQRGKGFAQIEHRVPMLSLDSLTSSDEVREFDERVHRGLELANGPVEYSLEPKYDGVSATLLYENGLLVHGVTRGDGRIGEDITVNLRQVAGFPGRLAGRAKTRPELVEVRGEVILSKARFAELRVEQEERGEAPFRNARNAVAGSLKRIDPRGISALGMEFFFWGVGDLVGLEEVESYTELAARFGSYGFRISPELEVAAGVDEILAYHERLEARRDELPYEMDGVVGKVNNLGQQRRLGRTARAPRWAFAHKFAPRRGTTRVRDIRVQVGRTGTLTPVAVLEPIELAGVTVQRATLHNFDLLREKDVRVGDLVEIERAGDVIPEVTAVRLEERPKGARRQKPPKTCPVCGESVAKEGAYYYCTNIDCPAQIRRRIVHLAARRALDIDRLGPKYVDQLFDAGLIRVVEDVFRLPKRKDEILDLERWGEQSFANLASEVERAKKPSLPRFLYALGIRHVGEKVAADLAEAFGSLTAIEAATQEQLVEIEGIGPTVAAEVEQFFRLPANRRFLEALRTSGVEVQSMERDRQSDDGPLAGRVFVFTGGLDSMTRDQARERVESLGAATAAGISKRVTDVVAGPGSGSKRDKAEKLDLRILSEEEFLALIADVSDRTDRT